MKWWGNELPLWPEGQAASATEDPQKGYDRKLRILKTSSYAVNCTMAVNPVTV